MGADVTATERPDTRSRGNGLARWWRRRTLRARLSLLVAGAVAVALLALASLAWAAVGHILDDQLEAELVTDARAIAAQPDQWRTAYAPLPDSSDPHGPTNPTEPSRNDEGHGDDGHSGPHDLGPRWQILDAQGAVISESASSLPVTTGARQVAAGLQSQVKERITIGDESFRMLTLPASGGGAVQVAVDEDDAARTQTSFGLLLVACCLAGVIGAGLLGRAVANAGLRPVQRLTAAVEEVAATADLTQPIEVNGDDEVARLGRSVNTMLAAIDAARTAQRALVEDASHELRTPLTSLRTNIELLLDVERHPELAHRLPPGERVKLLHDLDAQVGELATLSTELVELAREETSRGLAEPVDVSEVVTSAINRVRMRAPQVSFTADLEEAFTVEGHAGELERMVLNVLDNAAKWSPPGAVVHTTVSAEDPLWGVVRVSDAGPGIDEADRPHVFDRFYRAPAARAMPGSGLGLAIVAQTAAQHGGEATVAPGVPNGTVVTLRLPRGAELPTRQ